MAQKVLCVVGARPNFMKMAPVVKELRRRGDHSTVLVHTGQHYDRVMSGAFLDELSLGPPDHSLDVGAGRHGQQTAHVIERVEAVLIRERPDLVLVAGDVNSTLGAALAAVKLHVPVGHIESGLRSFDREMPEEINRLITDQLSTLLFTHSPEAPANLAREGCASSNIFPVGNTMIDTLHALRPSFDGSRVLREAGVCAGGFLLVTLHRPALVDTALLSNAIDALVEVSRSTPVLFPVHPRTRARVEALDVDAAEAQLCLLPPLGYLEFMGLVQEAAGVLTDSGGIQEETTVLGVPCFTLRSTTERPVTISHGTNVLLGLDPSGIAEVPELLRRPPRDVTAPVGWDGLASSRLVDVVDAFLASAAR